jgi:hypothetical protein
MGRGQESLESTFSETEIMIQEYRDRLNHALEIDSKKLKEKAERDSSQIIVEAKEEAEKILAQAKQEARVQSEVIEHTTKRVQVELARAVSEVKIKTSVLLNQVNKSVEQIVTETETKIKVELDGLTAEIAESEKKLLSLSQAHDRESGLNSGRGIEGPAESAASLNPETVPLSPSSGDKKSVSIPESGDTRIFKGHMKLEMVPPYNQERLEGVPEWLVRIPGLKVHSTGSRAAADRWITTHSIELKQPLPLLKILRGVSAIKNAAENNGNIILTLK